MRVVFLLFLLWILGLNAFLPTPVLVILCAAMGSGVAATLWFALSKRRLAGAVIDRDTKGEFSGKSR
jgi:hypothetical protein